METKQDPRSKNEWVDTVDPALYLTSYRDSLHRALDSVPPQSMRDALGLLESVSAKKGRLWVAGNGGSAAISEHLCCDFTKGTFVEGSAFRLRSHTLTAPVSILTALANDFHFDEVFRRQLEMVADENDGLILISSSGNSPNILSAAKWARQKGLPLLGLTGFSGGELKQLSTVSLHVDAHNYGIVEDAHQALMHVLAQTFYKKHQRAL